MNPYILCPRKIENVENNIEFNESKHTISIFIIKKSSNMTGSDFSK